MIVGRSVVPSPGVNVQGDPDKKVVSRYTFPLVPTKLIKLSVYLDGQGAGIKQRLRGVIYLTDGTLVAAGDKATVEGLQPGGWVDLTFPDLPAEGLDVAAGGQLDLGVHFGPTETGVITPTIRVRAVASGTGKSNTGDAFSDGPSSPFGSSTSTGQELVLVASVFEEWVPPREIDYWYASLPFYEAQEKLSETGIIKGVTRVQGGWHHTRLDPAVGSYAIVRTDGPLAHMVGERIKITERESGRQRQVSAYVHREAEITEDLSLPRRLFAALSLLPEDEITVDVEVYS